MWMLVIGPSLLCVSLRTVYACIQDNAPHVWDPGVFTLAERVVEVCWIGLLQTKQLLIEGK